MICICTCYTIPYDICTLQFKNLPKKISQQNDVKIWAHLDFNVHLLNRTLNSFQLSCILININPKHGNFSLCVEKQRHQTRVGVSGEAEYLSSVTVCTMSSA